MRSGKFRAYYVLIQDLIFSKHTFYMFFALTFFLSYCMATLQKCFDNNLLTGGEKYFVLSSVVDLDFVVHLNKHGLRKVMV